MHLDVPPDLLDTDGHNNSSSFHQQHLIPILICWQAARLEHVAVSHGCDVIAQAQHPDSQLRHRILMLS